MFNPSAFRLLILLPTLAIGVSACDQLGIETPAQTAARQEAEGKAVGGACRHAGRALEDCFKSSPKTSKAAIYAGWRDMDGYMRDNKIDVVPTEDALARSAEHKPDGDGGDSDKADDKASDKSNDKSGKSSGKQT